MSARIGIGGATVTVAQARDYLAKKYNPDTVRFYDYGGDPTATTVVPTPGPISFADLGRVVCVGASLTYARGHALMRYAPEVVIPKLATTELARIPGPGAAFRDHADVRAVVAVFDALDAVPGLGWGTVGKLLHLKFPAHLPIPDSAFRAAYRDAAVAHHNAHHRRPGERPRRARAPFLAYWGAFHADLLAGKGALLDLRKEFGAAGGGRGADTSHVRRLRGLPLVRLLDALAWGVGSGRLGAARR